MESVSLAVSLIGLIGIPVSVAGLIMAWRGLTKAEKSVSATMKQLDRVLTGLEAAANGNGFQLMRNDEGSVTGVFVSFPPRAIVTND